MIHIAEGDWARAERLLTQGVRNAEAPLVNYLLAARAAQLQGARERRDEWLKLAYEDSSAGAVAALLTKAELQVASAELDRALDTLREVEAARPDHPAVIGLLAQVHLARNDRAQLAALLPRLARARLPPETIEAAAAAGLDSELARDDLTKERLAERWASLSGHLRQLPPLIALRASALHRLGRGDDAEKEIRGALKRAWHPALVAAYGEVRSTDSAKQLRQAESWLKDHPRTADCCWPRPGSAW